MSVQQAVRYKWSPYVEAIEMDGEWVVLHVENYTMTKLNDTGGWIWSMLSDAQSIGDLVEGMKTNFEISGEQAQADIETFLGQLVKASLVEIIG